MICETCKKCSWLKDLDYCSGMEEFDNNKCPVEERLSRNK